MTTQQRLQWQTGVLQEAVGDTPGSVGPCGPEPMAVGPLPAQGAPSPLSHWMCTSSADVPPVPQVPVHKPSHTNQVQGALVWAPVTAQGRALLVPLHIPQPWKSLLWPLETSPPLQICWCSPPETLSSDSAPIARRFLSVQGLPLPSCTSSRAWNQLWSSCSSFFAAFLHPPCSSFLHHSRHSQDMLLTLATSLAIFSRRSRGEERKACKNWRVRKAGLKEE